MAHIPAQLPPSLSPLPHLSCGWREVHPTITMVAREPEYESSMQNFNTFSVLPRIYQMNTY